jgi:hypothetical protein
VGGNPRKKNDSNINPDRVEHNKATDFQIPFLFSTIYYPFKYNFNKRGAFYIQAFQGNNIKLSQYDLCNATPSGFLTFRVACFTIILPALWAYIPKG